MASPNHANPSASYVPSLAEQQQYWDARWERTPNPNSYQLKSAKSLLTLLQPLSLKHPKILDLGCGTGWFTAQLAELGDVCGIDLSERAISIAKQQFPHIMYTAGNLYELPLSEAYYDIVVSLMLIAHVEDQVGLIDRISAVLKPGGYLALTTINKFVIERMHLPPDPCEHIKNWLDLPALQSLLQPRFRILRTTTIIPMGNRGILRFVNSGKLNTMLGWLIPRSYLDTLKERAGWGYVRIVLAQKQS